MGTGKPPLSTTAPPGSVRYGTNGWGWVKLNGFSARRKPAVTRLSWLIR